MKQGPLHSVAMVGIVQRDGMILAVRRRDNGHWEPPAGVLELDEGFRDCVEREIFEETQIVASAQYVTGIYKNLVHPLRPVTITWLCDYVSGDVATTEESSESRWLSRDEVRSLMAPAHAARVFDAVSPSSDGHVAVRVHNGVDIIDG
jgi:8-oxo-dGTP diphosphatase